MELAAAGAAAALSAARAQDRGEIDQLRSTIRRLRDQLEATSTP